MNASPWKVGLLLLAMGCSGAEPTGSGTAALLRALSELPMGVAVTPARLRAWGPSHGLPACEPGFWEKNEVGVEIGGCSLDEVRADGVRLSISLHLRWHRFEGPDAMFLEEIRIHPPGMGLMDVDGKRPDVSLVPAAREAWGPPTRMCDGDPMWLLSDRVVFLSWLGPREDEPPLVQAPLPPTDVVIQRCLAAAVQSPTRTNGAP